MRHPKGTAVRAFSRNLESGGLPGFWKLPLIY
jgi:hypothetical protein